MRLLLGSAHLLQERLEGDEAVIVGGVAELLHQVLGLLLGQLLTEVHQQLEQLELQDGVVGIFVVQLQDLNEVVEATLVLGVLAGLVHGDFGPVFTFDSSERAERQPPQHKMAELGLKKKEIDAISFAFDVYDFKGDGKVDAFYVGDLVRACNLNPTLKTIKEIGSGVAKGEKFLTKPDVFPMYKACKDSKDQGGFHDFVEILKLYDKNADDTILEFELFKLLVNLGEKLTKEEAKNLMKELCDPADDDGFIPFKPFLEKMCAAEK